MVAGGGKKLIAVVERTANHPASGGFFLWLLCGRYTTDHHEPGRTISGRKVAPWARLERATCGLEVRFFVLKCDFLCRNVPEFA